MKTYATTLTRYCLTLLVLIVCYVMFAVASCLMPDEKVRQHALSGIQTGDLQTDYPRAIIPEQPARMDNFTDALIINQACHLNRENIVQNILLLPRAKYGKTDQTTTLQLYLQGTEETLKTYPRYWHGNTFLMRYLLAFLAYPSIRLLLYLISSLLLGWLVGKLWQLKGWLPATAVVTAFVLVYGYVMQFSMQFFPVLALALIGSLLVCKHYPSPRQVFGDLFVIGSLTAYFDLLTVPLLTLGLPLALFCYLHEGKPHNTTPSFPAQLAQTAGAGLLWSAGFVLTWMAKWLLASIFTSENVFNDAFGQAFLRIGASERNWELADFSRWTTITANIDLIPFKPLLIIIIVIMGLLSATHFKRNGLQKAIILILIALLPYIWYFILANHSYQHWWFTYRTQMFSITAVLLAFGSIIDWPNIKSKYKLFNFKHRE